MTTHVLSSLTALYAAVKAALVASGLGTVTEINASYLALDLPEDYVDISKRRFLINVAGTTSYTIRAGWVSLTTTSLPNYCDILYIVENVNGTCVANYVGANGDAIEFSDVAGVFGYFRTIPGSAQTSYYVFWKDTSNIDSVVRYFAACNYSADSNNNYNSGYTKRIMLSPYRDTIGMSASSFRTIGGDGITQPCVVTTSGNGLAVTITDLAVCWRSDLSLESTDFTIGTKVYRYVGVIGCGSSMGAAWRTS